MKGKRFTPIMMILALGALVGLLAYTAIGTKLGTKKTAPPEAPKTIEQQLDLVQIDLKRFDNFQGEVNDQDLNEVERDLSPSFTNF